MHKLSCVRLTAVLVCHACCCAFLSPVRAQDSDGAESREAALLRVVGSLDASDDSPSILRDIDLRRASEAERQAVRTLRSTRLRVELRDETLDGCLATLRAASGLTFVASAGARQAIEAAGLTITFAVDNLPLENALNLLSFSLRDYRFVLRYGAVVLVKNEEARPRRVRRVYDVSDLVRPRSDFPAPKLALDSGKEP